MPIRLPALSRPTTKITWAPTLRFITAMAPTAGPSRPWPHFAKSSAQSVSGYSKFVSHTIATIYREAQGISSCWYSLAITPPACFAQLLLPFLQGADLSRPLQRRRVPTRCASEFENGQIALDYSLKEGSLD